MTATIGGAQLKVGAHVLVQLGSELVTDVEQAMLECVKNAYDADATGCVIVVDSHAVGERFEVAPAGRLAGFNEPTDTVSATVSPTPPPPGSEVDGAVGWSRRVLSYQGSISIVDTGDGMTPEQLRESWLVVSGSAKRGRAGSPKGKTNKGRTPLGDKGLGRLGTMKLGDILVVETATAQDGPLATAQFRWADCEVAKTVDEIPVNFEVLENAERFKGTRVKILGLNDLQEWRRPQRINEITVSLAKLISPFEATSTFPVSITLDDNARSLVAVTNDILDRAIARFDFAWTVGDDGNMQLVATARLEKRLLTADKSKKQVRRTDVVFGDDNGLGFENWLRTPNRLKGYAQKKINEPGSSYVELERRYEWSSLMMDSGAAIADPGPLTGAFYFFHLGRTDESEATVAGIEVNSKLIKGMTGVAILRDGFRVRSQGDWLELSSGMTSGSTYGLRVDNTIGYFALSGEDNFLLVEKSDREGFVEDAAYRGFMQVAKQCKKFSNDALEIVRRSLDEYARRKEEEGKENLARAGQPLLAVARNLQTAQDARDLADKTAKNLNREVVALQREAEAGDSTRAVARAVELAKTATDAMDAVRSKLLTATPPSDALLFLRREIQDREDQVTALFESAAVGLSARGLVHELKTHLDEIRQRSTACENAAMKAGGLNAVLPHLRAIRGSCAAISSVASLIDPMLPRSRTIKEVFSVADFVKDYAENRQVSFGHADIQMNVTAGPASAVVRMNRPRLLQVLDNMVQNSRYWLKRGAMTGETTEAKKIEVAVGEVGFVVSDTGPGVDAHVEDRLFELFVSGRPDDGGGQGIGLYIVTQLLALDGCSISLLPDRNARGRRYRFEVDLSPVLVGGNDHDAGDAR